MVEQRKEETVTAQEYFDMVKEKKVKVTDELLLQCYENAERLLQKAMITKQRSQAKKLVFHLEAIEKERELIKLGIDTFVYKEDIENYIDNVAKNTVKVIELERYEREIPDEIVEVVAITSEIFDEYYVIFTDYTGKVEKEALKERKEKDPILFGVFQDSKNKSIVNRFYFLGDWEDEHCDLTLDKMVSEVKIESGKDIIRNISTPMSLEEIKKQLELLEPSGDTFIMTADNKKSKKEPMFSRIRTFFQRKN